MVVYMLLKHNIDRITDNLKAYETGIEIIKANEEIYRQCAVSGPSDLGDHCC